MDTNFHQNAKAPMIALIKTKNIMNYNNLKTKTKRTAALLLMLLMLAPAAARAQQQTTKPLPYSYGFEDAGDLDCWEVIATSSNTGIANANDAPEGSKVFRFHWSEQNAYLASPVFSGTEQGLDVAFQYMKGSTTTNRTERFQVGYTTDADAAPADFTYGETIHGENHWVTYANTFPANTKRIAIKYIYTDGLYLRLDDFNFEATSSSCPRPFNLTAGTPGAHSVELSWTEIGEATAWQICLNDDEENLIDADTNPYTLTGLNPVTEYTVKVRANCGSEQSAWSIGLTFTTPCETFPLPYSYGFEDAGDLDCWEVIATSSSTGIATVDDAPEGSKVFRFHWSEQNAYLASPVFSGTEQGLDVAFQYMNGSTTTSRTERFQVGYTTDESAAPADFTYGDTIHGENHWVTYANTFPPNTKRIAIKYIYTNGMSLRLDDFNFVSASCPRPINLTAGTLWPHSVELSWTERGEATAWQICLNDDEENLIDADTNPYTLTGLNPVTEYTVKVRANCGSEQSAWSNGLTFTLCEAFALPYSYGFEDAGDLDCWEVIATNSYTGIATANDAPEGSKVFCFHHRERNAYLASPMFSGTEQGLDVAFQYMNASTTINRTEQFQVGYTTDAGAAPADFTYGDTIYGENHWVRYENIFPANTKRIAIKYIYTNGMSLRLDDFNFESASCPRPTNLTAGTPGLHSVELSWTERGEANAWQICVNDDEENLIDADTNPYTLTGLNPGTEYTVKVRANCGSEQSAWSNGLTFTTLCEAFVALPYSYGFENAGNLDCWEVIATSSGTGIGTAYDAPEGSKVFRFHYSEQNAFLASPVFSGTELGLDVAFQYMNASTTSIYTEQFQVGYTTDEGAAPADFTYGDTIHGENHWVTYENTFPANTKRIAIKYIYADGMFLRLDDFNFEATCPIPTNLTAESITATTADLSWNGSPGVESFTVRYRTPAGMDELYTEDFESETSFANWTFISMNTANNIESGRAGRFAEAAHSGLYGFSFSSFSPADDYNQYLVSPELTVTGELSFYFRKTHTYTETLYFGYSTTTNDLEAFTWTEDLAPTESWQQYTQDLPTDVKYVAFHYFGDCEYYVYVDDIVINTPAGEWETVSTTEMNVTLTDLTPNTLYEAQVKGNCDDTHQSKWSNAIDFTTLCGLYEITLDAPYYESFETPEGTPFNQAGPLPDCWQAYRTTINGLWPHNSTSWHHDGLQSLAFYNWYDPFYAILPQFSNPLHELQISFWMTNEAGALMLGYLTAEDDGTCNTFTAIATYPNTGGTTTQRSLVLDNVPAVAERLAFRWTGPHNDGRCFIDDVTVSINPAATFPPHDIAASNITPHEADITWEGYCDSYALRYRQVAIAPEPILSEGFEGGTIPEGWNIEGDNLDPTKTWRVGYGDSNYQTGTHNGSYNARITHNENDQVTYLVMPAIDLSEYVRAELSFWYVNRKWVFSIDEFAVCYRIGSNGVWNELWSTADNHETWTSQTVVLAGLADNYQIGFRFTDHYGHGVALDDIAVGIAENAAWTIVDNAQSPHTLSGLTKETPYQVQVKSNCAGYEDWSETVGFTTMGCEIPANVAATDITPTSAAVSWTGFNDNYNLSYRRVPNTAPETILNEGFEGGTMPQGWTIEGDNLDPSSTWRVGQGDVSTYTGTHSGDYNALITRNRNGQVTYLVMPALALGEYGSMELSFWYINRESLYMADQIAVCYRIGNEGEWHELWSTTANHQVWTSQTIALTGLADNYQIGFRVGDRNAYGVGLDDIALCDLTPFQWITVSEAESPHTLTGLRPETEYEVKVQGVCEGEATDWSESAYFTTLEGTTFTKDIIAHTDNGGWYLIASPVAEAVTPTAENGFLANEYDLYRFNQSAELEWENWKAEGEHYHFNLEAGRGYLYANSGDVTLTFVGTPHAATEPVEVPLAYDPAADFAGWNLVGNPLPGIAFIDRDFYVMNGDRDEIVAAEGNTVELMEGIFVIAEGENDTMTFTPASQSAIANNASLVVNLSQGRGSVIDRAIVRFDSNRTLPKFQLNPSSTKVYIPQGGKDYAVVAAEQTGEMPLNFKAEKNGNYTLRFDTKDVAFDYLHLIDNLTGADVDLLTPPAGVPPLQRGQGGFNYTFTAKTTDYASRFRLVFSAGDAGGDACEPPFAYINNSNIIINGTGTLQIIDILGKELVRKELSTLNSQLSTFNFAPGVYVLRLVDGDTVRTQKIVVEF